MGNGKSGAGRGGGRGGRGGGRRSCRSRKRDDSDDTEDGFAAMKAYKFTPTQDDTYCGDVETAMGPTVQQKESTILLIVLDLGPQLKGYGKVEYALPMEQGGVQLMAKELSANNYVLPSFNIQQGDKQKEFRLRTMQGYKAYLEKKKTSKNLNTHYVSTTALTVAWNKVQARLSKVLQFFRNVWILNPDLTREEAYKKAMLLLTQHVPSKRALKRFFPKYIKQIREIEAHNIIDNLRGHLNDDGTQFKDASLVEVVEDIREVFDHLEIPHRRLTSREVFDRLKTWYDDIPIKEQAKIDRFEWLDTVVSQEPPEETDPPVAKEGAAVETDPPAAKEGTAGETEPPAAKEGTAGETEPPVAKEGTAGETEPPTGGKASGASEVPVATTPNFVDLTVDDLEDMEEEINTNQGKFIVSLASDDLDSQSPQIGKSGAGGRIVFMKADAAWADAKNWEFAQIQGLVNLLFTCYGLKLKTLSPDLRTKRTILCGEKLGFFQRGICKNKAHVDEHLKKWISPLLSHSFPLYMSAFYTLFAATCHPKAPKNKTLLRNCKMTKSAMKNKRFTPPSEAILRTHLNTLLQLTED